MSDVQQGPGWWMASDGRWYPPESRPALPPPPPPPPVAATQPITAKGVTGTITFDGRMVTINHSTVMGRLTAGKGEKRVPISSIAGIEWKPPGMGVRGFIRFTIPGGIERTSRLGHRTQEAARDENAVLFGRTQVGEFEQMRNAIERAIASR